MAIRTGKVILASAMKLDEDYKNVLDYSEANMVTLVNNNKIAEFTDCSFLKPSENIIQVDCPYGTAIRANYLAFENPDYSNKWFFAFIDDIEYVSEKTSKISFTIDEFSTWHDYWTVSKCFVEREHTNDDTVGANLMPENLETGEYYCNSYYRDTTMDNYSSDLCFIMASTSEPVVGEAKDTVAGSAIYNGIYTGLTYYRYDVTSAIDILLEMFANYSKTSAINGIFMAPKWLAPLDPNSLLREVQESNTPSTFNISVTKQTTLNSYSPVNNKLKCFPYNYLLLSNNIGQNIILHYEKFSGANATFTVRGVLNPGCSIQIVPTNYNGCATSENDSIQLGKFPICNFQNDMYTNWLTQNSINVLGQTITTDDLNITGSVIGGVASTATNLATGNYLGAGLSGAGMFSSIANAVMQKKQHNMITPTITGQLNSADVNVASGNNTFHFYKMSVKQEFAKMADSYFTMFGYATNQLKVPNLTGRRYFNFVKISEGSTIGHPIDTPIVFNRPISIPQKSLDLINSVFQRGVTIWHDYDYFENYSVNNVII